MSKEKITEYLETRDILSGVGGEDSPVRMARSSHILTVESMFKDLVIKGMSEFAPHIAESFKRGFGVKEDKFLADLTLVIGKHLEFPISTVADGSIKQLLLLAQQCVKQIKANMELVEKGDLSYGQALELITQFDQIVQQGSSVASADSVTHSYIASIPSENMQKALSAQSSLVSSAPIRLDFGAAECKDNVGKLAVEEQRLKELEKQSRQQLELEEERRAAEELHRKEIEEDGLKAEADRIDEEQRLKELEQQSRQQLVNKSKAESLEKLPIEVDENESYADVSKLGKIVQLNDSPKSPHYGSIQQYEQDSYQSVTINISSAMAVDERTSLLQGIESHQPDSSVPVVGEDSSCCCCNCCGIM